MALRSTAPSWLSSPVRRSNISPNLGRSHSPALRGQCTRPIPSSLSTRTNLHGMANLRIRRCRCRVRLKLSLQASVDESHLWPESPILKFFRAEQSSGPKGVGYHACRSYQRQKSGCAGAVFDFGHSRSSLLRTLWRRRSIWSLMSLKSRMYFGFTIAILPSAVRRKAC